MAETLDVLAFGNINTDMEFFVDSMPGPDGEVTARDYSVFQGGSAANFSVAAARLGLASAMWGCVGGDAFGREAVSSLRREGVSTDFVKVSADDCTGMVCVLVEGDGVRRMVAHRGANRQLESYVRNGESLPEAKVYQLSNVKAGIIRSALCGKASMVSLDPGGEAKNLRPGDLRGVDILLLSEVECASITGLGYREGAEALSRFVGTVVVKRGGKGAFAREGGAVEEAEAFKVGVVDTTGAGDAFDAGFIAAVICGKGLREALAWGSGTAALKIQKRGARDGLPTRKELRGFLSAHPR